MAAEKKKGGSQTSLLQTYYEGGHHSRRDSQSKSRKNAAEHDQKVKKTEAEPDQKAPPIQRRSRPSITHMEEHDENSTLLCNDFVVMMDCSPQPDEVFCVGSPELGLACMWLDKLITLRCNTLSDLRMRNVYMSHLVVCLYRRQLTGIFREKPPEELVSVNFGEERTPDKGLSMDPLTLACTTLMQKSFGDKCQEPCCSKNLGTSPRPSCHCGGPNREASCCSHHHRHPGGTSTPETGNESTTDDELLKKMLAIKRDAYRPLDSSPSSSYRARSQSSPPRLSPRNVKGNPFKRSDTPKKGHFFMRKDNTKKPAAAQQDMIRLIKSIKRELSGGADLEWNEHLETELRRYREFSKKHREEDPDWAPHMGNDQTERYYLLVNMQKDLIRMLSEEGVKVPE